MKTKQLFSIGLILGLLIMALTSINAACSGCLVSGSCYAVGERFDVRYCDLATKAPQLQKTEGLSCINDFECEGDLLCLSGRCYDIYNSSDNVNQEINLTDSDNDGFPDIVDNCWNVPNFNGQLDDIDNDRIGDDCDDSDGDTFMDNNDTCPYNATIDQTDSDGDGMGNFCDPTPFGNINNNNTNITIDDTDGDGWNNTADNCPFRSNPLQEDTDLDSRGDACDNCWNVSNSNQLNSDNDTMGDACDPMKFDTDNDNFNDTDDNCKTTPNPDQTDTDHDGIGDACDTVNPPAPPGGPSNGGGTTTTSNTQSGNSYTLSDENFLKGYTAYLRKGDIIFFKVGTIFHTLEIKELFSDRILIEFDNNGKEITLTLEKASKFDVTNDAYYDVEVLVKSIYYDQGKVALNLKSIKELKSGTTTTTSGTEIVNEPAEIKSIPIWVYILVIGVILVGIAIVAYLHIRKKRQMNTAATIEDNPNNFN